MKKTIITTLLVVAAITGFAQKRDTVKVKPVYEKFIAVPVDVYQQLVGVAGDYKSLVIYSPLIEDKNKVNIQQQIDKYLFDLPKRVRLDSVIKK